MLSTLLLGGVNLQICGARDRYTPSGGGRESMLDDIVKEKFLGEWSVRRNLLSCRRLLLEGTAQEEEISTLLIK